MPEITAPITTRTVAANGLSFAIDEAGEGADIALCLHGFPESRLSWRHQLPMLAAAGWHAVAPDLRGYGGTTRPPLQADYHLDHLTADAAALFDVLGAQFDAPGAGRRLLIAHDWGALIAWVFALRKLRALDGLVIMNVPHPKVFTDVMRHSWAQRRKSWYAAFFQLPWLPEALLGARHAEAIGRAFTGMAIDKSAFPPDIIAHYRDNASQPGALTAMINYYRANARALAAEPAPLIETPTLMLWGEEDTALGLELTQGYAPLVRDFELVRFPQVSHWVQQEAPDKVNAAMRAWLGRKLG
jgi:pimeloyl-ACP methyl ester carboxylesterase